MSRNGASASALNSARTAATKQPRSVRITITTSPRVEDYLRALVPLGLYGSSVAEVAERIICEGLRGDLKKRKTALLEERL